MTDKQQATKSDDAGKQDESVKKQEVRKTIDEILADWPSDDDDGSEKLEAKANPNGNGKAEQSDADWRKSVNDFIEESRSQKSEIQEFRELKEDWKAERTTRTQEKFVKDMKDAVDDLKETDGDLILGLALVEFERNPELVSAWNDRGKKPKQWREVVKALGEKISGRVPKRAEAKSEEEEDGADDNTQNDAAKRRLAARAAGRTSTTSSKRNPLKEEDERALEMKPGEFAQHFFRQTRTRI